MSSLPPPPPPSASTGGSPTSGSGTNGLAIASLVVSLTCCGPVGAVLGFVALGQIKRSGEQGRGMAVAGVVVGVLGTLAAVASVVAALLIGSFDPAYL